MSQVRPLEAIPFVELPADYQMRLGPLLAEAYEKHGPIFRSTYFGQEIVYLVGPEANRFVLVYNRFKFSSYIGWSAIFILFGFPVYLLSFLNPYVSLGMCSCLWIFWAFTFYERNPSSAPDHGRAGRGDGS